jgi:hypothetical protein
MPSQKIGNVTAKKSGKQYEVKWDSYDRSVYVSYAGGTKAGKASSVSQAMNVAEAFLHNK